jgi:hypothetical protein
LTLGNKSESLNAGKSEGEVMAEQEAAKIRMMNMASNVLALIALALGIPMLLGMLDLSSLALVPFLVGAVAFKVIAGKMEKNSQPD